MCVFTFSAFSVLSCYCIMHYWTLIQQPNCTNWSHKKTKHKENKQTKNRIRTKQINWFFLWIKVKYILLLLVATSAHWMFDLYIYIYSKHHPKFPFRSGIFRCYQLFFEKPEKIGSFDYGIKTQRCLYLCLNLCCHPVNMINTACFTDDVFKEANSKGICKILLPSTSICEQNLLK